MTVLAALLLLGCARAGSSPRGAGVDVPGVGPTAPEDAGASAPETCSVPEPSAVPAAWGHLLHAGEVAFRSYYLAENERGQSVLLQLGPAGEPMETPVPARTESVTEESATRLRFVVEGKPPRWFTVDLANPDAPAVSAAAEAPGLAHPGTLKGFASDGERALLGRYLVDYDAKPTRYHGETALHSVPDGTRASPVLPVTAWSGACRSRRCVAVASGEGLSAPFDILGIQDSGSERLGTLDAACMGWADWVDGERYVVARPVKAGLQLFSVELGSWQIATKRVPLALECPWVRQVRLGGRAGVLFGAREAELAFLPVSSRLEVGESQPLPKATYGEQAVVPLPDGALVVEQKIGHGMVHSPTDSRGVRRYHRVWSFDGRAALLRSGARGWRAEAYATLPHSGEEGDHSDGFRARPLVRPGFAAVLVDDRPSGESRLLAIGRPCR